MAKYSDFDLERLHKRCYGNAPDAEGAPAICRCFFCGNKFMTTDIKPSDILNEADGRATICCPECNVDAVLVERSGIILTDGLVDAMYHRFFENQKEGGKEACSNG